MAKEYTEYRCIWVMDVVSDSPENAARAAQCHQQMPTICSHFTVIDRETNDTHEVNIDEYSD